MTAKDQAVLKGAGIIGLWPQFIQTYQTFKILVGYNNIIEIK